MNNVFQFPPRLAPEDAAHAFILRHADEYLEPEPAALVERCGAMLMQVYGITAQQATLTATHALIDHASRGERAVFALDISTSTALAVKLPGRNHPVVLSIADVMAVIRTAQANGEVRRVAVGG